MTEDCGLISKAGRPVPLQGISVKGDILGAGARVTIRQRYKNIENQPIEAIYKFPLPEGSAVCGFQNAFGRQDHQRPGRRTGKGL